MQQISTHWLRHTTLTWVERNFGDRVLDDPDFARLLTDHDLRGLTPLFWSNVALHGTFELDLDTRIDYDCGIVAPSEEVV